MKNIKEDERLHKLNHSCAHLLAHAISHLYNDAKFWVGPVIDNGFYYDMDLNDAVITEEDLPIIEKEMKKIAKSDKRITRIELSKEEALEMFKNDPYKVDLIEHLDGNISAYRQGDFIDLCKGPHVDTTKELKYFKLLKVSGAYFKGDSKNHMLQRVYGICFDTEDELLEYLDYLKEQKERDHRNLNKELDFYFMDELVGPGLALWLPNGSVVRRILERYIVDKELALGYHHVYTPVIATTELYKTSGHFAHYKDDMYPIMKMDNEEMVLRPMNCPHHMLMFKHKLRSYRDLPLRIGELGQDFRFEASGALSGLERVRGMCQNDAHIFIRKDGIKDMINEVVELILDVYKDFGFNDYRFRLSLRDSDKEKYYPDDDMWNEAEGKMRECLKEMNLDYYEAKGEAAFYGPKLDVQVRTALNKEVTLSTCQLDFLLPQKFDLTFINEHGEKERPVVIHRAILGTFERFVAFLLEETKGKLPAWLAPIQVNVIPINNKYHLEYAKEINDELHKAGIRTNLDDRNEKLSYKMREAQMMKYPFNLILGQKEVDDKTISFRLHGEEETKTLGKDEFINFLKTYINEKR